MNYRWINCLVGVAARNVGKGTRYIKAQGCGRANLFMSLQTLNTDKTKRGCSGEAGWEENQRMCGLEEGRRSQIMKGFDCLPQKVIGGHLGGSEVECLPLAQGVIPWSQDRAPHRTPCMEPASPTAYFSACLSLCVSHE